MKLKKLISNVLGLVMTGSAVATLGACGGGGKVGDGDDTVITVKAFGDGIGVEWLEKAAERFQAKYAETSFKDGETGVYVEIASGNPESRGLSGESYHLIVDERDAPVYELAKAGDLISINDIVTKSAEGGSLESRINENVRDGLQYDGEYYALPQYELFGGLTFDQDAFLAKKLYLAKDASNAGATHSFQGSSISLIKNADSEKSYGPDGVYGTTDDGLPASFEQLLVLCDYIKKELNVAPFEVAGSLKQYVNYLYQALWASLAGYEELSTVYNFDGKAQVVTGFESTNLFAGNGYAIKTPTVVETDITNENGYLADHTYSRYLSAAFIEIAYREGWFTPEIGNATSDIAAMEDFVVGSDNPSDETGVFLVEGSYWYYKLERQDDSMLEEQMLVEDVDDLNLQFMSMPTWVKTSELPTEALATAKKQTLMDNGTSYMYINGAYINDKYNGAEKEEIISVCKTFMEFLYSKEEVLAYASLMGVTLPMNDEIPQAELAKLPTFKRSTIELAKNSNILYYSSSNPVFLGNIEALQMQFSCTRFKPADGSISSYVYYLGGSGHNAQTYFEETRFAKTAAEWAGVLGNAE